MTLPYLSPAGLLAAFDRTLADSLERPVGNAMDVFRKF
jgi:hypothetical protein